MPNNELPNLSTWHRVPVGTVIPKGVPFAYVYKDSLVVGLDGYPCDTQVRGDAHYTEHPITPLLPTEDGAMIVASGDERLPPHILLTREGGHWVTRYGAEWAVDEIRAWAPVTIGEMVVVRP